MSRRAAVPGADELLRTSGAGPASAEADLSGSHVLHAGGHVQAARGEPGRRRAVAVSRGGTDTVDREPSGRQRHEEKITVYVSSEELFDLEHARLVLRGEHGIAADRGRLVREALAVVLADLETKGASSILVRRLSAR